MRRTLLAALLTAVAMSPVHAAPGSAIVTDPANDWVPSQDVVRLDVSSGPAGKARVVKATFRLTAAPDAAATYQANLETGRCDKAWSLKASGLGTSSQKATLERLPCMATTAAIPTAPATVTVKGTTVEITAPYAVGLVKGLHVKQINGFVGAAFAGTYVGNGLGQDGFILSGDLAWSAVDYRLR